MMDFFRELFASLHTAEGLTQLIQTGGYPVLALIVFAETGLLIGFFLPGDSLLITAGILSSTAAVGGGIFDPFLLIALLSVCAIAGDQLNRLIGFKTGPMIFERPDGRIIKKKYFIEAREFYLKHGAAAIVLARFVPILRTFVPFIAGVVQMSKRRFLIFNIVGGTLWVVSMILIGYFLGNTRWAKNLHQVIVIVVLVSVLPLVIGLMKRWWIARSKPASIDIGR